MESDLPFRSLAVAIQPVGQPMPSDDELRKAVAPLVAANDIQAFDAMWRGGAFLISTDASLRDAKVPMIEVIGNQMPLKVTIKPLPRDNRPRSATRPSARSFERATC